MGDQEKEKMVAVLRVMKNGGILKNIYLLSDEKNDEKNGENVISIGRSVDCDINLSHPSISRFHLNLFSTPQNHSLFVLDLNSVHGTWVMGKKIEPNVRVELNEGDTMQIGGSSRVYRLHWVPLCQVHDIENSFVPPSYVCEQTEDREQEGIFGDNGWPYENMQVPLLDDDDDDNSGSLDYESSDENSRKLLNDEIPSELPFAEEDPENKTKSDILNRGIISNCFSEKIATEPETEADAKISSWFDEILQSETEDQQFTKDREISQTLVDAESEQNIVISDSMSLCPKECSSKSPGLANFDLFSESEIQQLDKESESLKEDLGTPLENKNTSKTDQGKRMSPTIFSEKGSQKLVTSAESKQKTELLENPVSLYLKEYRENPGSTIFGLFSGTEIEQLDNESASREENKGTPLGSTTTTEADQGERMILSLNSEKATPNIVNTKSIQKLEQLDKENESQEENMGTPLGNTTTTEPDLKKRMSPSFNSEKATPNIVDTKSTPNQELILESSMSLYRKECSENPGSSANCSLLSKIEIQQLDKESESQKENMNTPPDTKNQNLVDTESKQNFNSLRSSASLVRKEYDETSDSANFCLFSEMEIQQLDKESESQEENMRIPLETKKSSEIKQDKRIARPSIFSENHVTWCEILSSSDDILLNTENQQFDEDKASMKVHGCIELEQNASSVESLASHYSHELDQYSFSPGVAEVENQQVNKENESQEEIMESEQSANSLESLVSQKSYELGEFSCSPEVKLLTEDENVQVNKQNESQEDIMELEQSADSWVSRYSHGFSENLCSPEVPLFTEIENHQQVNKEDESRENMQLEEIAESLESFVSQSSHQLHGFISKVALLTEAENPQVNIENETKEKNMEMEQSSDLLESLASPNSNEIGEYLSSPEVKPFTPLENMGKTSSTRCNPSNVLTIQTGKNSEMKPIVDFDLDIDSPDPRDVKSHEVIKSPFTDFDAAEEAFTPHKEKCTSNTLLPNFMRYSRSFLKRKVDTSENVLTNLSDNSEQFTPDKENYTPNTLLMRSMVRMRQKINDIKGTNLYVSSSLEHFLSSSVEENPAPKLVQDQELTMSSSRNQKVSKVNNLAERVPFQSLIDYSTVMRKSETYELASATKSCDSLKHAEITEMQRSPIEDKWKWHMVVDTACLLNKESRKVLQLLQGLKGTQMVIPRSVIRDLDSMDRQGSLFKRKTEASWALEWIEECMVSIAWWIHVQCLEEEPRPTAPTPLVISNSRFSEVCRRFSGLAASSAFSAWGSLFEIISPTAGDHALECALQLRGAESYGKVVILSDDITLKIKAMAEGFMCETAQEFRDSLVNPFSERFLWIDSSPRGLTWSCKDDMVLKEKFYRHSMKLGEREGAKGLKLIIST